MKKLALLALASVGICAASPAVLVGVDVSGIESWDSLGDANNIAGFIDFSGLGLGKVTAIGWEVNLRTLIDPSWLSEIAVYMDNSSYTTGIFLTPGVGDDFSGSASYSSGGMIDLTDVGLYDIDLSADGIMNVEFFEQFDDYSDEAEGIWDRGSTLYFEYEAVPEPASMLALGAGLAALAARRRRK